MLLSEFIGKEVINLEDGSKLGTMDDCDLVFDCKTGELQALVIPNRRFFDFLNDSSSTMIPWNSLKRIGEEVIIVDLSTNHTDIIHKQHYFNKTEE